MTWCLGPLAWGWIPPNNSVTDSQRFLITANARGQWIETEARVALILDLGVMLIADAFLNFWNVLLDLA
jgi:hypothetical protein